MKANRFGTVNRGDKLLSLCQFPRFFEHVLIPIGIFKGCERVLNPHYIAYASDVDGDVKYLVTWFGDSETVDWDKYEIRLNQEH